MGGEELEGNPGPWKAGVVGNHGKLGGGGGGTWKTGVLRNPGKLGHLESWENEVGL